LREVFQAEAGFVLRILRRLGVPDADLEDAAQDVFLVVHRKLPEFDARSGLRGWLFGIASRVALARRRRAHVRHEVPRADLSPLGPEAPASDAGGRIDARALLIHALEKLDVEKRAVFVLYELEGFAMAEVAAAVECPLQTAYSRLRLARDIVRRSIERKDRTR
jgi:RNA polymerase sigma-70 factor (ECF subfamily)